MEESTNGKTSTGIPKLPATIFILLASLILWLLGLLNSPLTGPDAGSVTAPAERVMDDSAQAEQRRRLAEDYWTRYPDIGGHHYFGKDGPLGINGAWEHYRQHGRHEGRTFWTHPENERRAGESEPVR